MCWDRREIVAQNLADSVRRLDSVLQPWGFVFTTEGCHASHHGPFATGCFVRDKTRISLSCRDTIDNMYYEHSFITEHYSSREIERYRMDHPALMRCVGHSEDCHLIGSTENPDLIVARDGGDRVAALIHDLTEFAISVLAEPCDLFFDMIRKGRRSYSVE